MKMWIVCVYCGNIVSGGATMCDKCNGEYKASYSMDSVGFVEEVYGIKVKWHQRLLLKIYAMSFKKHSRKGLHR